MKKTLIIILVVLTIMSGCAKKGDLKVDNKTDFEYNSNASSLYDSVKDAELGIYEKFITEKAKVLLQNQKIYLKVSKLYNLADSSISVKNKYTGFISDQSGNTWNITIETDEEIENIEKLQNIKLYGIYKGIDPKSGFPIIYVENLNYIYDDDYINKEIYEEVVNEYLEILNSKYLKENFKITDEYKETKEGVEILANNASSDIKISFVVDTNNKKITRLSVNINSDYYDYEPMGDNFGKIDKNFWIKLIVSYNETISDSKAEELIDDAWKDCINNSIDKDNYSYLYMCFGNSKYDKINLELGLATNLFVISDIK